MLLCAKLIIENNMKITEIRRSDRSKRNLEWILKNFVALFGKDKMTYEIREVRIDNYTSQVRVIITYENKPSLVILAAENVGSNARKKCYDEIIRNIGFLGINSIYNDTLNLYFSGVLNNNGVDYSGYPILTH